MLRRPTARLRRTRTRWVIDNVCLDPVRAAEGEPRKAQWLLLTHGHLLYCFGAAAGHLVRRYVFFVSRDRPGVAEGIYHLAVAVAPEHVHERHLNLGAGGDGLLEERVDVLHVEMDGHRRAAELLGR